jgi:hypothetical protein
MQHQPDKQFTLASAWVFYKILASGINLPNKEVSVG